MTKTKASSKNKKNVNSNLSEDISTKANGITTPHGFTTGVGPIMVGALRMSISIIA